MKFIPERFRGFLPGIAHKETESIDYLAFTQEKVVANKIVAAFLIKQGIYIDYSDKLEEGRYYRVGIRVRTGENVNRLPIYSGDRQELLVYSGHYIVPRSSSDFDKVFAVLESAGLLES